MEKFVLITGGAGGIGLAITKHLAENGFKVFCADINLYKGISNGNIIPLIMDVTKPDSINAALEIIKQYTSTLYAVINNAGIFFMCSMVEVEEERLCRILDINLMGMFRVNKAAIPLLKSNYSKIINISSDIAQYSSAPFNGPYVISKNAVEVYSDALRRELSLLGIPVIKIRPGAFKTGLLDGVTKDFESLSKTTTYFKNELKNMNKLMARELNKTNNPELLAALILSILKKKKPKHVYRIKNSRQLKLLGLLPEKIQDMLYSWVLGKKVLR